MPRADETCSMSKTVTKFQTCLLNSKQTSEKKTCNVAQRAIHFSFIIRIYPIRISMLKVPKSSEIFRIF